MEMTRTTRYQGRIDPHDRPGIFDSTTQTCCFGWEQSLARAEQGAAALNRIWEGLVHDGTLRPA